MGPAEPGAIAPAHAMVRVQVLFSPWPREVWCRDVALPAGSTVGDAVAASGLLLDHPTAAGCATACWGRAVLADAVLRDGDRIEVLRPLKADPKESRRLRYRGQPARRRMAGRPPSGEPATR
jgi:putative ubiquitin-RnfH superfamily antitoxin RatB of RatAB toxin-antitoxin module